MSVTPKKVGAQSVMGSEGKSGETASDSGGSERKRKENLRLGSPQTPGSKVAGTMLGLGGDAEKLPVFQGYGMAQEEGGG